MAQYRIICTTQQPPHLPNDRAHIVAVGTGVSAATPGKYWLLSEVLAAMARGDTFYTFGETSLKTASVHEYVCQWAQKPTFNQLQMP